MVLYSQMTVYSIANIVQIFTAADFQAVIKSKLNGTI